MTINHNFPYNYAVTVLVTSGISRHKAGGMQNEPKNLAWCGLMTSTKRSYLVKLLQNTINELVIWNNLDFFIKQLDERAKTCRECGYKYSEIPIDKGKYQGDNEPIILVFS